MFSKDGTPNKIDRFLEKTILWILPQSVTPNQITAARFLFIPFVIYFLLLEEYKIAFPLFAIAAFTDALDGALARTRNQVTEWGKAFDPIADKLLIASSAIVLIADQISLMLGILMVAVDALIGIFGMYQYRVKKNVLSAHWTGKMKMIFQSLGIAFFLLFFIIHFWPLKIAGLVFIYLAIGFGVISAIVYRSA